MCERLLVAAIAPFWVASAAGWAVCVAVQWPWAKR